MRLLLAEDEKTLARALVCILERNQYQTDAVYDGESALRSLRTGKYDAAILDIMMPKMDGLAVLEQIRENGNPIPILILSAKSEPWDRVSGLDKGANDYLGKPFSTEELLARVRAMTRDLQTTEASWPMMGNIRLNRERCELSSPTGSFCLGNKEYQVMELLMYSSEPVSVEHFMERIWGYQNQEDGEVVTIYISYLRKKLSALQADVRIVGNRSGGYFLEVISDG